MIRHLTLVSKGAVLTAVFSAVLAACAVGPDYSTPRSDLAPFHNRLAAAGVADAAGAAARASLDQWWTGFNDPMLAEVVQRALDQNLDLAASIARVQQARAAAASAGADLLPSGALDASASYQRQSLRSPSGAAASSLPGYSRGIHDYSAGPAASWELDLFGGLRRTADAFKAEAQAAEADHFGTRVIVAADAADAYLQIRSYQARLAVAQHQIDDDEHLLRLVRDRYAAGAATGREVAQADALLKQARTSVPPLTIGLEQQLNRLDVLMGVQPGTYAQQLGKERDIPSIPPVPADSEPSEMLRRRPDIIAAERRLAASSERIGAAVSNYYPKFSLSAVLGFESAKAGKLFTSAAFQPAAQAGLRWRLFDFGKVDAEVAQAKGGNAEALALYRQSVLKAAQDVEDSLTVLVQTQLRLNQVQEQVDALVKSRDLSEQAYRSGSITLTDVLDADRQLLNARDELASSKANAARAAVGVYRALGGGWSPATTVAATDASTTATTAAGPASATTR
ncbi:efflux transporter outer membrane subunit [Roseateles sp.]|uniref:efflux transporter outer membrane subunit n=1 Tax=Roseateles sp. TaxID=1971397 RepID=UPI002F3E50A0